MKVYITNHFRQQLYNRALDSKIAMEMFYEAVALIKKKKIRASRQPRNALKIFHKNHYFIYKKERAQYKLITFYRT